MGGRGSVSASGASRLPGGAAAMTVTFQSGAKNVYKVSRSGVLLQGDSLDGTFNRAGTDFSIRGLYDRAQGRGLGVELHSASEVARGEKARAARKAENAHDVASAEVRGTSQSKRLSKLSGRVRAAKRRW